MNLEGGWNWRRWKKVIVINVFQDTWLSCPGSWGNTSSCSEKFAIIARNKVGSGIQQVQGWMSHRTKVNSKDRENFSLEGSCSASGISGEQLEKTK